MLSVWQRDDNNCSKGERKKKRMIKKWQRVSFWGGQSLKTLQTLIKSRFHTTQNEPVKMLLTLTEVPAMQRIRYVLRICCQVYVFLYKVLGKCRQPRLNELNRFIWCTLKRLLLCHTVFLFITLSGKNNFMYQHSILFPSVVFVLWCCEIKAIIYQGFL